MLDNLMEDIREKLESDLDGTYNKWLIKKLQDYKSHYAHIKQELLQPKAYNNLVSLDSALNAALIVIYKYQRDKNKTHTISGEIPFSSLFRL